MTVCPEDEEKFNTEDVNKNYFNVIHGWSRAKVLQCGEVFDIGEGVERLKVMKRSTKKTSTVYTVTRYLIVEW